MSTRVINRSKEQEYYYLELWFYYVKCSTYGLNIKLFSNRADGRFYWGCLVVFFKFIVLVKYYVTRETDKLCPHFFNLSPKRNYTVLNGINGIKVNNLSL